MARRPNSRLSQLESEAGQDDENSEGISNDTPVTEGDNMEGTPHGGSTMEADDPSEEPGGDSEDGDDTLVEVEFNGRKLWVAPEDAEAIKSDYQSLVNRANAPATEDRIPNPNGQERRVEPPAEEDPNYEERLFEDPGKFFKDFRDELKAEVREELTEEYRIANDRQQFWNAFYAEHPELKEEHTIVQAVMSENWNELGGMSGKAARDRMAELTKQRILSLGDRLGGKRPTEDTESLEGGRTIRRRPKRRQEDPVPESLSAGIRARREERARKRALISQE